MKKLTILFLLLLISTAYSAVVITVNPIRPPTTPFTVTLSATPNNIGKPYVFEWDFEGDGIIDETTNAPNNTVLHEYTTGLYYPTVTILEALTEIGTDSKLLIVPNAEGNYPPIAYTNGPYTTVKELAVVLNATAPIPSIDEDGSISEDNGYSWAVKNTKGNACTEFTDDIDPVSFTICNEIGTAEATLTVTDNLGESTSATTTITVIQSQSADMINIVDIKTEPEILKMGQDLKIIVRVRNVTTATKTFNIEYEIKLDEPNINLTTAPKLMWGNIPNQQVDAYPKKDSQKDFVITIPNEDIEANLENQKNYWVYVKVTKTGAPAETNLTFNTRRTIFTYNDSSLKSITADETSLIPIIIVLISVVFILNRGKKHGPETK